MLFMAIPIAEDEKQKWMDRLIAGTEAPAKLKADLVAMGAQA
jgi:hypothetical protein